MELDSDSPFPLLSMLNIMIIDRPRFLSTRPLISLSLNAARLASRAKENWSPTGSDILRISHELTNQRKIFCRGNFYQTMIGAKANGVVFVEPP